MSTDSPSTEAFEDVDPDPDAVLAEFGVDSPDELVDDAGDGAHDPTTDDEIDADDTTAAELFADLEAAADDADSDAADAEASDADAPVPDEPEADASVSEESLEFEFVGDADEVVRPDGDVIDTTAAELSAVAATGSSAGASTETASSSGATASSERADATRTADAGGSGGDSSPALTVRTGTDLELVGPEPTPTRVENDAFSGAGAR